MFGFIIIKESDLKSLKNDAKTAKADVKALKAAKDQLLEIRRDQSIVIERLYQRIDELKAEVKDLKFNERDSHGVYLRNKKTAEK